MIKEFNRRIDVLQYTSGQDDRGGNITTSMSQFSMWAKVENTSGNRALDNAQITYSKSFRITVRHERSRPIRETNEILYEGEKLVIHNITKEDQGRVNFLVIDAYATDPAPVI